MHVEVVALGRRHHKRVEHRQVRLAAGAHRDALALRQAHVVAPFALHARKDVVLAPRNVQLDCAAWLDALQAGAQAQLRKHGPVRWRIGHLRLNLEHRCAVAVTRLLQRVKQPAHGRHVVPINQRPARHVAQRQPQPPLEK